MLAASDTGSAQAQLRTQRLGLLLPGNLLPGGLHIGMLRHGRLRLVADGRLGDAIPHGTGRDGRRMLPAELQLP